MSEFLFLSTLPLRRATLKKYPVILGNVISIHAPLAESDGFGASHPKNSQISIHAPLAESDETFIILPKQLDDFYPRSPCGERLSLYVI